MPSTNPSNDARAKAREALQAKYIGIIEQWGVKVADRRLAEELGISEAQWKNRVRQWKHSYPSFNREIKVVTGDAGSVRANAMADGFPTGDFLQWRTLTCAYKDLRRGRYVRAENNWYQQDAYKQLQGNNRLVIVLPPGHIKTTMFSIEYPTFRISDDRDFRTVIVQKNQDEAKKIVSAVQERLSDPDYYDGLIHQLKAQGDEPIVNPLDAWFRKKPFRNTARQSGDSWGAYGFRVLGRSSGEKDLSMEAKGVGSQIQGVRADLIILDDIQDPMATVGDSEQKLDWFNRVIMGRVTDYQQVVVLANYFTPDDFAHKLIESHPEFAVVEYPAIIEDEHGNDAPLCPEFWTLDALEMKKSEVGERVWHYTWMQEAGDFDLQTFKRDSLEAARDERYRLGEVPHDVSHVFIGCDPAVAASGFCAIIAWGLNQKTKQRYLIDIFNQKGMRTWENVIDVIEDMAVAHSPYSVTIELANTQGSLAWNDDLQRRMRSLGTRIETYKTMSGTGARAEQGNFDITTIGGLYDSGLVTLPYGGTFEDREKVDAYIQQFVNWRTDDEGHSIKRLVRDMVMATLFAESEAFKMSRKTRDKKVQPISTAPPWAKRAWGKPTQNDTAYSRNAQRVSSAMAAIDEERENALDRT